MLAFRMDGRPRRVMYIDENVSMDISGAYSDKKSLYFRVSGLPWPTSFAPNHGGTELELSFIAVLKRNLKQNNFLY